MLRVLRVLGALASVAFITGWFLALRPTFLEGPAGYMLVSGESMEPTLFGGDLVITQRQSRYQQGDVVAFRVPKGQPGAGEIIIHRIVGGNADEGFVMRGDNKDSVDPWHPPPQDIVGKRWITIPGGADFFLRLRHPLNLALIVAGLGMLLILTSEWRLSSPLGGRQQRHQPDETGAGRMRPLLVADAVEGTKRGSTPAVALIPPHDRATESKAEPA